LYRIFEQEKQKRYEQRVHEVEMDSFIPLVFSTFGGMGSAATTVFKQVASPAVCEVETALLFGLVLATMLN